MIVLCPGRNWSGSLLLRGRLHPRNTWSSTLLFGFLFFEKYIKFVVERGVTERGKETDNVTHFKSKENLLFWSERPRKYQNSIMRSGHLWLCEFGDTGNGYQRGLPGGCPRISSKPGVWGCMETRDL